MEQVNQPGAIAPRPFLPTKRTLFHRSFLLTQLWRFLLINLKMTLIILKGHK